MIDPDSTSDLSIERLVRASLDRDSERLDPRPMFEKILAEARGPSSTLPPAPIRKPRGFRRWAGIAAAAATTLVACLSLFLLQDRVALAKGETVVREARWAHLQPIDRCYLVEVRRDSSLAAELAPRLPQVRQTRLWTRGDRFWVESVRPDQRWAWGRDEANRFWIAFGPHSAVRYEADEIPDWLGLYCDLHSLNLEGWLSDVVKRFDLTREPGPEASTIRVHARPRQDLPKGVGIEAADFEVDAETRVIRRMVLRRVWNGQPFATVTFNLAETDALDPADYQVQGHLADPSAIFTRDHEPQRRKDLVARWFGNRPGRWLRPADPPLQ